MASNLSISSNMCAAGISVSLATASNSNNVNTTATPISSNNEKDKDTLWYFTAEQLSNSPSRRHGIDIDQELSYRQMTAYLIQEMGQRLQVSQLCINTAIVYMHRFYAFHSFTHFHRNGIAAASLFLAAKVEEQPRKLEHVIKAANKCLNQATYSTTDSYYIEQAQDLVFNENVLLQTLGFDVAIDHPHTHVVKTCHLVKACKDLAQTSYFLASNSLHLTSMCLQYKPTVVACFCIYLACKWSRWEIPQSTEGKHWFHYVDKTVTMDLLKQLTDEFIAIYEKSPARLKSKLNSIKALAQGASTRVVSKDKKTTSEDWKMGDMLKLYHSSILPEPSNGNGPSALVAVDQQPQQLHQLLPPPAPQQQQPRRSDTHPSHHRTYPSSHPHSKQILSTSDIVDNKSIVHKQSYGPVVARSREPQPTPPFNVQSLVQPPNISRSSSSSGCMRSSLSNSTSIQPQQTVPLLPQRVSSQSNDLNINKNRTSLPNQFNTQTTLLNQKISNKSEPNSRNTHKDTNSRLAETSNISSNKVFASAIQSNVTGGSGSTLQLSGAKVDIGMDMTRNLLQQQNSTLPLLQQRAYNVQLPSGVQHTVPPPAYPQLVSNRNSSVKYDQQQYSLQHSVQHQQPHQKQVESSYSLLNQAQQQQQLSMSMQYSRQHSDTSQNDQMELCSPPKYSQYATPQSFIPSSQLAQNQSQTTSKVNSMFSPEWNDKLLSQGQAHTASNHNGNKPVSTSLKGSNKDSPKKNERDRSSSITMKKERNKAGQVVDDSTSQQNVQTGVNAAVSGRLTQAKPPIPSNVGSNQKHDTTANTITSSAGVYGGFKRTSSNPLVDNATKLDAETVRDAKIRKLEAQVAITGNFLDVNQAQGTSVDPNKVHQYSGVVNCIETNPDLVSTLLKESLCTTNGIIKKESNPSPVYKLQENEQNQPHRISEATLEREHICHANTEEHTSVKSEKKKKKEKHKHKEKDKSKDREERKKHKKDKDRHKERERDSDNSEHVKIKISKDKICLSSTSDHSLPTDAPATNAVGFKIKIPKDRIIGDISGGLGIAANAIESSSGKGKFQQPPALKIKISKDKIESYGGSTCSTVLFENHLSTASSSAVSTGAQSGQYYHQHGNSLNVISGSINKKKDRDREREKEKKKNCSDHKLNGSNGNGNSACGIINAAVTGSSNLSIPLTLSKSQNCNKFHAGP